MPVKRNIEKELLSCAAEYPVVTILGPRQTGKTTLVRYTFPNMKYASLEDPDVRLAASTDPRGFLNNFKNSGAVLDEVQRLPELLSYIQGIVDNSDEPGKFILTGSHQPRLHEAISQSLAGRTAVLTLWPFSLTELRSYKREWDPFELIVKGFFPRIHEKKLTPRRFFNSYFQTYIERDLRALINLKDLSQFQKFLVLLAGRTGQIINYSSLASDTGVSSSTIKNWISLLKALYVIFELPPFYINVRKRFVKSPKIYFTDTGLVSFLLGIHTEEQAMRDPLRGNLYENMVIVEILKGAFNIGIKPDVYFFRDSHGNEVDLIIKEEGKLVPVEIKSASTFSDTFLKGIKYFRSLGIKGIKNGSVLYNGDEEFTLQSVRIFNPLHIHEDLWKTLVQN